MKVHAVEQGSVDWALLRSGIPTASEFDSLVTPEWKVRTGDMPRTYLAKKVAEAWQGGPLAEFWTFDIDQGKILEERAIPWYELTHDEKVERVGFITTDDGRVGCSPDGLLGDNCGIEIKCPAVHTHVGYLLGGDVPPKYQAQVQGSMLVTGRETWKFLSYRYGFPPLMVTVFREDAAMKALEKALAEFLERFDEAMAKLEKINGGPPKRKAPMQAPKPEEPISDGFH